MEGACGAGSMASSSESELELGAEEPVPAAPRAAAAMAAELLQLRRSSRFLAAGPGVQRRAIVIVP